MNNGKKIASLLIVFFLMSKAFSQDLKLDLSLPEHQKDILQYLRSTVSMLSDHSLKEMMKGYDLKNFNDSNKADVAKKMMNDTAYIRKLMEHFAFMGGLEKKYQISKFSDEEWREVARFGSSNGIYFTDAMRRIMEQKSKTPGMPSLFPAIPIIKTNDTIPPPKPSGQ